MNLKFGTIGYISYRAVTDQPRFAEKKLIVGSKRISFKLASFI